MKDVLPVRDRDRPVPRTLVRPLPPVTVEAPLRTALETMRAGGAHLVRVVDGGRTVGVVAMEDVLEELIGDVRDASAAPRGAG